MPHCPRNLIYPGADVKGRILLTIAVVCGIAFLSAWATGLIVSPADNWLFRYRFIGAVFAVCMGCTYLWSRSVARQQLVAERYFSALSQIDAAKLAQGTLAADLPAMTPDNPWYASSQKFTDIFRSHCDRLMQLEHSRSALEVRLKRSLASQSQMNAILHTIPEAILVVDQAERLVLANPAAEQLLGIDLAATTNRDIAHVLPNQALNELIADTLRHKASSQRTVELELPAENGKTYYYGATARKIISRDTRANRDSAADSEQPDDAASTGGAMIVLRDLSQLKASQQRNAEFVSAVSHEMKTPLAGIKAYVELLLDGDADDEQTREEFFEIISGQANRLQRLIDNLLNLARIEAGVVQVSKEAASLNELLEESLEVVRPAAEAKSIELSKDLSQLYIGVFVDRDMLTQAAINLLSNAIKYTPVGGKVALRSRLVDQEAVFDVADTGVGLGEEDRVRVFEKFYRVNKDRAMAAGTGLGLPLAKHIVEDVHGGRLSVDSQLGQGSTFRVTLPVAAKLVSHV